jgi:6-pyruvoyltetrahydropterin/6-carboxytetrahydropterin synthase
VTVGFEIGTSAGLRALHRIPWLPPPEGDLHAHDYRVEVIVARESLDGRGMVCDLDVVEAALRAAVGELEGKDLDSIRRPDEEAVTVEILARWFHAKLGDAIHAAGGEELAVRIWESPTAFGGYRAPVSTSSE